MIYVVYFDQHLGAAHPKRWSFFVYALKHRIEREAVCALCLPVTRQGSTPPSLILLSILHVLLRKLFVTSRLSCLACKGKEHGIQKIQTYTTSLILES